MTSVPHSGAKSVTPGGSVAGGAGHASARVSASALYRTSALLASRDDVAFRSGFGRHLWGWYVEPHPDGGIIVVATDGKAIGILRDVGGYASAGCYIYATDGLKAAVAPPKPLVGFNEGDTVEVPPRLIETPGMVYATEAGVFVQHSGSYEDDDNQFSLYCEMAEHGSIWSGGYRLIAETMTWRQIPDAFTTPQPGIVYLDPELLARFSRVRGSGWFLYTQADKGGVYRVAHPAEPDFVGFIMPCRTDGAPAPSDPDWFAKATAGETRNAEPIHRRDGDEG